MGCLPWPVTTAPVLGLRTVRTARVEDPGPLLRLLPERGALCWTSGGEGLVGWGEVARVELAGPDRFAAATAWWCDHVAGSAVEDGVGLPGTGPVAFGSFSFDADAGTSVLVVPEVVVGHHDGTWWVTTTVPGTGEIGPRAPLPVRGTPRRPTSVRFADATRSSADWVSVVADAVRRIEGGEVAKVVLARDVEARTGEPLDVRWPLQELARDYPGCWTFAVDGLLGATPEMLVRLRDGVATSRVLAGTLRRSGDLNRDLRQSDALERSIKDVEEHGYGVR